MLGASSEIWSADDTDGSGNAVYAGTNLLFFLLSLFTSVFLIFLFFSFHFLRLNRDMLPTGRRRHNGAEAVSNCVSMSEGPGGFFPPKGQGLFKVSRSCIASIDINL